jgi:hypothetical protein
MTSSNGFGGEELKSAQQLQVGTGELQRAQGLPLLERSTAALHEIALSVGADLEVGPYTLLQILLDALETALGDAEIGEDQLVLHRLRVARGIDRA